MAIRASSLKADIQTENDGQWMTYPEFNDPDFGLKVRALTSTLYTDRIQKEARRLNNKYGRDPIPDEENIQATAKALVDTILLDWKGITDDAGQPIPYSRDLAYDWLTDPAYRELRGAVMVCAGRLGQVKVESLDEDAKKSAPPSVTASTGVVKPISSSQG
jgi:hypothetical protein